MKNYETSFKRILAGLMVFGLMLIFVISSSCDADVEVDQTIEEIESANPVIISFSPLNVAILEDVLVEGEFLQFVDRATIGGVPTEIKSRISDTQILLRVNPEVVSGQIVLINDLNRQGAENLEFTATSSESLSISYPVPAITSVIPAEATANDLLIIEGSNLGVVSSVTFGDVTAVISFQEDGVLAVTVPNPGTLDPVTVTLSYNSNTGEVIESLSSSFLVNIPTPEPSAIPRLMTRDNIVTIVGDNINFTSSVTINGINVDITTTTRELTFMVPASIETGITELIITDTEMRQSIFNIPYINGEYLELADFDTTSVEAVSLDLRKDPLVTSEIISDPAQQPVLPDGTVFGNSYYKINYGTRTGSTVGRLNVDDNISAAALERLASALDGTSFGGDPVLHFWMRTADAPTFKIYMGSPRRELQSSFRNTGGDWVLIAVKLKDFISGGGIADLNFRLSPTSASSQPEIKSAEYDWFMITDRVLTEFGAQDYSDTTTTTDFWKAQ